MGLNVRLNNLNVPNNFTVEYSKNDNTNYLYFGGTYSSATTSVVITNLEFNTTYYIRITDIVDNKSAVTIVYTHESKIFECYDTVDFFLNVSTGGTCTGKTVTIYDSYSGNTNYGNHSSVINNTPNSYRVYTGLTYEISASTFVTTATTNPTTGIVYEFENFTPTHRPVYIFLEHGDGSIQNNTNIDPKKQGGFQVKVVFIGCPVCFNHKCSSGDTGFTHTLYSPVGVYNDRPYYKICCDDYVAYWSSTNNRWEIRDSLGSGTLYSYLDYDNNYPISDPPTKMWSAVTVTEGNIFFTNFEKCPPPCDIEIVIPCDLNFNIIPD